VPGWQFQWVMGLEWGTSSWTLPVDARRLPEGTCPVTATAGQIRDLRVSRGVNPEHQRNTVRKLASQQVTQPVLIDRAIG
jgi:hypothetical protein